MHLKPFNFILPLGNQTKSAQVYQLKYVKREGKEQKSNM